MKQVMYSVILGVIVLLSIIGIISVQTKTHKEKEIDDSLNIAIDEALEELSESSVGTYESDDDLLAAFEQILLSKLSVKGDGDKAIDPNFQIKISAADVDSSEGFLAVKVEEQFTYPNNKLGKIEEIALITREQENQKHTYKISFVNPKEKQDEVLEKYNVAIPDVIKEKEIEEGRQISVPSIAYDITKPDGTLISSTVNKWKVVSSTDDSISVGTVYASSYLSKLKIGSDITGNIVFEGVY
ncbi:MAG: hypothetical protein K6B67_05390 [Lachnospiraceae bacterium]|nr:hypothetical protein [Lachnospiraceae bacterium]